MGICQDKLFNFIPNNIIYCFFITNFVLALTVPELGIKNCLLWENKSGFWPGKMSESIPSYDRQFVYSQCYE